MEITPTIRLLLLGRSIAGGADNVTADPGAGGATFATDDIGGVHFPRTKIIIGVDGTNSGDISGLNPMPVTGVFFSSSPTTVTGQVVATGILPVTGAIFSQVGITGVVPVTGVLPITSVLFTSVGITGVVPVTGVLPITSVLFTSVGITGVVPVTGILPFTLSAPVGITGIVAITSVLFTQVGITGVAAVTGPMLGNVAHGVADAGNPVKVGGRARNAEITAVSNDQRSDLITDLQGKLLVMPYSVSDVSANGNPAAITTGASVSVIPTQAGLRIYVTDVSAVNSHASIGTTVTLLDGDTSSPIWQTYAVSAGGGTAKSFTKPPRTTVSNPLFAKIGSSGANVILSVQGYYAP